MGGKEHCSERMLETKPNAGRRLWKIGSYRLGYAERQWQEMRLHRGRTWEVETWSISCDEWSTFKICVK